jgi:hypothetical protein
MDILLSVIRHTFLIMFSIYKKKYCLNKFVRCPLEKFYYYGNTAILNILQKQSASLHEDCEIITIFCIEEK